MTPPVLIIIRRHSKYYTTLTRDNDNYETHRVTNLLCKALGFTDASFRCQFMNQFVFDNDTFVEIIVSELENIKNKPDVLFPENFKNEQFLNKSCDNFPHISVED